MSFERNNGRIIPCQILGEKLEGRTAEKCSLDFSAAFDFDRKIGVLRFPSLCKLIYSLSWDTRYRSTLQLKHAHIPSLFFGPSLPGVMVALAHETSPRPFSANCTYE